MTDDPRRNPDGTMKKGHSANPKGRPVKHRNLMTIFNEKRDEEVTVMGPDKKPIKMPRLEAWVTNLWNKAIALDGKASSQVLTLLRESGQLLPPKDGPEPLDDASSASLDALIARLAKRGGSDVE